MLVRRTDHLTGQDMEGFGTYISIDLCERPGEKGRRQNRPMVGMFTTRLVATTQHISHGRVGIKRIPPRFRGSDFSVRVALLVQGWYGTGLPVLEAAEKVAGEYESFLKRRLGKGKRGRHSPWSNGTTEIDETVRTTYYKFFERYPEIDVLLEFWFAHYLDWCDWVVTADEGAIDLTVQDYLKRGQPENAKAFGVFAKRIRQAAIEPSKTTTYKDAKWYAEAEPEYVKRVTLAEAELGSYHPIVNNHARNLARFYHDQSKYEEALYWYWRAWAMCLGDPFMAPNLCALLLKATSSNIGKCEQRKPAVPTAMYSGPWGVFGLLNAAPDCPL